MKERVPARPPTGGEATEGWRRGTKGAAVVDLAAAAARGLASDAEVGDGAEPRFGPGRAGSFVGRSRFGHGLNMKKARWRKE